ERSAGKLARSVLRGRRRSNVPLLPDLNVESRADTALMEARTKDILALLNQ
ncbi:hypothetical protein ACNIU2_24120, partial [Escherichia coli]